jgi:hypothetical protein
MLGEEMTENEFCVELTVACIVYKINGNLNLINRIQYLLDKGFVEKFYTLFLELKPNLLKENNEHRTSTKTPANAGAVGVNKTSSY